MFPFICQNCGYAFAVNSGVPDQCPLCKKFLCIRRCTPEEYLNAETNDGKYKS